MTDNPDGPHYLNGRYKKYAADVVNLIEQLEG